MSDTNLKVRMQGKHTIQTLIIEKQCRTDVSYQRAVHLSTLEFAKYFHDKEVLEIIGGDYLIKGIEDVKTKFNEGYYLKLCTK
tara:strand:+ start:181 stop:429 length:249 start_codon:yes stop_codon:yes gene_type:complete